VLQEAGFFVRQEMQLKIRKGGQPCMRILHAALHEKEGENISKGVSPA
jgi:hypothetical protein